MPMASVSVVPASGLVREPSGNAAGVDRLPDEMNDMKIRDEKVIGWWVLFSHNNAVKLKLYINEKTCVPSFNRKWKQPLLMEMAQRQVILLSLQLVGKMVSQNRLFVWLSLLWFYSFVA